MAKIKDKERILKAARKNQHVTYKGTPIRLSADFQQKLYRPEGRGKIYLKCKEEKIIQLRKLFGKVMIQN